MKTASFNVNGIRARLSIVLDWLRKEAPDVLCLQETKVQDSEFPAGAFEEAGYHCRYSGQKGYNGVAILTRAEPEMVRIGFDDGGSDESPRLLAIRVCGVDIVNSYVPQGQDPASEKFVYKLDWLNRMGLYFKRFYTPETPLLWLGDLNVAPFPIDVYDPVKLAGNVGFHPDEQKVLSEIYAWGFEDIYRRFHAGEKEYTFYDYRVPNALKRGLGWRIDHIWGTRPMAVRAIDAWIDPVLRTLEKPSDHTVIAARFAGPEI